MMIPEPGSKLERELQAASRVSHGVTTGHRCVLGVCHYHIMPGLVPREKLSICTASLQYHVCSKEKCTIACPGEGGAEFCPITGIEVQTPPEVYYPMRARGRGSWSRPYSHCMTQDPAKRKRRKAPQSQSKKYFSALSVLLLSETARDLRQHRERSAGRALENQPPTLCTAENVRSLTAVLTSYVNAACSSVGRHRECGPIVSALLSFLATGLVTNGVTLIPRVPWIAKAAPHPQDYGKFRGFKCRPLSSTCREIKRLLHDADGNPDSTKIMHAEAIMFNV